MFFVCFVALGRMEEMKKKSGGEGLEEMRMKEYKRSSSYLFLNLNKIISPSIIWKKIKKEKKRKELCSFKIKDHESKL
jgi:hypothetical protein